MMWICSQSCTILFLKKQDSKSGFVGYLNERKYVLFYHIVYLGRYIYVSGYIHMVFKKGNLFLGKKENV